MRDGPDLYLKKLMVDAEIDERRRNAERERLVHRTRLERRHKRRGGAIASWLGRLAGTIRRRELRSRGQALRLRGWLQGRA